MKKGELAIILVLIVLLIALIVDKVEKDKILDKLSTEQNQMISDIEVSEKVIVELGTKQMAIKEKLDDWDSIDQRWLSWIKENWQLVKPLGESSEP